MLMRFTLAAMLIVVSFAHAQPGPPLRESEITENAVLDALAPYAKTRSLRPVGPASASLLITFETNSARLTPAAERALDTVGAALNNERLQARSFVIEGHADRRGRADVNKRLSLERANAVRTYLTRKHNIGEARLKAVGKGDTEPLLPDDPAARENRRVTFVTVTE